MSRLKETLRRFREEEDGAALVEYTILLGILVVAVIGIIGLVGGWIEEQWGDLRDGLGIDDGTGGTGGEDI